MKTAIIIYAYKDIFLDTSIAQLREKTEHDDYEIVICADDGLSRSYDGTKVLVSNQIGRAKSFNAAVEQTDADILIFMRAPIKVGDMWLNVISEFLLNHPNSIVAPTVHTLDVTSWSSESNRYQNTSLDIYLNPLELRSANSDFSPIITSYCMIMKKRHFLAIGKFDEGMENGYGEDIEISIRNLALGNMNYVSKKSIVACEFTNDASKQTPHNKSRIIETWFKHKSSILYYALGHKDQNTCSLSSLLEYTTKAKVDSRTLVNKYFPAIGPINDLRNIADGKRLAIIAPGRSLDYINKSDILSHDIIIGVDYAAMLVKCDYAITDSVTYLAELMTKYQNDQFILPRELENRLASAYVRTSEITDCEYQYDRLHRGVAPDSPLPPFIDFEDQTLVAIHVALFMRPKSITLYGYDDQLIGGVSHTTDGGWYGDGKLLPNTESTSKRLAYIALGASALSRLAIRDKIPIIKVCHL